MNKTIPMIAVAMLIVASVSLAQAQDGKAHRVGVISIADTPVLRGADKVRADHQFKDGQADRSDDPAQRAGKSG